VIMTIAAVFVKLFFDLVILNPAGSIDKLTEPPLAGGGLS